MTHLTDFRSLSAASRPPTATTPVQLRPVDRYTLSDAILAAWHKHGNDSWCSIADEVITVLAAPQQGAPTLDDIYDLCEQTGFVLGIDGTNEAESAEGLLEIVRLALARYGAQAVPVAEAES